MWRTRPIFVSSTFQDMQAERDHLRTYVFPELEERLRAVRVHLEWVDLRLGIATASLSSESAREQQVLKVCLAEARRCRPFLIVLLGDRYGWIPPHERITAAAVEEGLDAEVNGSSVTSLEIRVGVLAPESAPHRCFVYLRDSLPYGEMPADVAAFYTDALDPGSAVRLTKIKQRLEAEVPDRMRHYRAGWDRDHSRVTNLDAWGRIVLEDLWRELSQDAAADGPELSPSQVERNAVEDFGIDRSRDFVGRERLLNYLTRFATSSEPDTAHGVCVTGDPGSGKSALFGELTRRLRTSGGFVLSHATDASPRSASVDSMLRRFVEELAAAVGVEAPPGTGNVETLDATFASLLAKLARRQRVIVLIDGLDQFERTPRGRFLTWLPRPWPANARLITTAAPSDGSHTLSERDGVEMATLLPLDPGEARQIAKAISARYHRAIEPDVLYALVEKTSPAGLACGNPLWLTIAVEELNLLDADDFQRVGHYSGRPAERLRSLMIDMVSDLPPDADALYGVVFGRAETLFGARLAQAFLGLIALSRGGWRETDFRALLPRLTDEPWDGLRFASFRRVFRGQLRQHGVLGQWDVAHGQMRAAARTRVTAAWGDITGVHTAIADHLLSLPSDDPLRVSETPRHLLAACDWRRMSAYYGDASLADGSVESATRALVDSLVGASLPDAAGAAQVVGSLVDADIDDGVRELVVRRLVHYLSDALEGRVPLAVQIVALARLDEAIRASLTATPERVACLTDLSVAQNKMGRLLQAAGRPADALMVYREASNTFAALAEHDRDNRLWPLGVAKTQENIGDLLFATGRLEEAMPAYSASVGAAKRLADSDPSDRDSQLTLAASLERVGRTVMARGGRAEALDLYRASAAVLNRLVESDPQNLEAQRSLIGSLHGVGQALAASARQEDALDAYRSSLTVAEAVSARDPEDVGDRQAIAVSQERIGEILLGHGDAEGARAAWEQSLAIREKLADTDTSNTSWQRNVANSLERIGDTYNFVGLGREAIEHYTRGIAIFEELLARDPENREWRRGLGLTLEKKAGSLAAAGQRDGALAAYEKSLAMCRALVHDEPDDVRILRQLSACAIATGDVLDDMGRADQALAMYQESMTIRERLAAADAGNAGSHNDLAVVHNRLGNLLAEAGRDEEALAAYRRSLDILSALALADPQNPMHQLNMAIGHERVARILAKDRIEEARDEYRTRVAIAEQLVEQYPGRPDWEDLLLSSYEKLRDFLAANAGRGVEWRRELMYRHAQIGELHARAGRLGQALSAYREQLAAAQSLASDDPGDLDRQRDVSVAFSTIGDVYSAAGQPEEALAAFQQDLSIAGRLAAADPADAQRQWDLSTSYIRIGDTLLASNQADNAQTAMRNGLAIRERIAPDHEDNAGWQRGLAVSYNKLTNVLLATDQHEQALKCVRRLVAVAAHIAALHPDDEQWRRGLAQSYAKLAEVLNALGRSEEALEASRQSGRSVRNAT
jgi:tetratricopeptide (TPR) repeat protein